jgi:hypothetical protein
MLSTIAAFIVPRKSIWTLQSAKHTTLCESWERGLCEKYRSWWTSPAPAPAEGLPGYSRATLRDRHDVLTGAGHPKVCEGSDGQRDEVERTGPAARNTHAITFAAAGTKVSCWGACELTHPLKVS